MNKSNMFNSVPLPVAERRPLVSEILAFLAAANMNGALLLRVTGTPPPSPPLLHEKPVSDVGRLDAVRETSNSIKQTRNPSECLSPWRGTAAGDTTPRPASPHERRIPPPQNQSQQTRPRNGSPGIPTLSRLGGPRYLPTSRRGVILLPTYEAASFTPTLRGRSSRHATLVAESQLFLHQDGENSKMKWQLTCCAPRRAALPRPLYGNIMLQRTLC